MKTAFPFVPNMEDCKLVVHSNGTTCYIMDTCCRDMKTADKIAADRAIVKIYMNAELKKLSGAK